MVLTELKKKTRTIKLTGKKKKNVATADGLGSSQGPTPDCYYYYLIGSINTAVRTYLYYVILYDTTNTPVTAICKLQ